MTRVQFARLLLLSKMHTHPHRANVHLLETTDVLESRSGTAPILDNVNAELPIRMHGLREGIKFYETRGRLTNALTFLFDSFCFMTMLQNAKRQDSNFGYPSVLLKLLQKSQGSLVFARETS